MIEFDVQKCLWFHEPKEKRLEGNQLTIVTEPHTDLWQRTYYHFQQVNAPILYMQTEELYFSFTVKAESLGDRQQFDQCGIAVYQDDDNWLKASIEYEDDRMQRLGSVVTNHGYSDWATTDISADVRSMFYRLSRRNSDFCIEHSVDGVEFRQMRILHLFAGEGKLNFGVYACSPGDSSFTTSFSEISIGACVWKQHD